MSDINSLNEDMEVGVDINDYEAPTQGFAPLEPGVYTLMRDTADLVFKPTKDNNIGCSVSFTIQDGPSSGRKVFGYLSTQVSRFRPASTIQDFLAATGSDVTPENGTRFTVREIKDAVNGAYGPFDAYLNWEGYCPECGKTVLRKKKNYPVNGKGEAIHDPACPECGKAKVKTSARITNFIMPE